MLLGVAVGCVGMRLYYAWRNKQGNTDAGVRFKY